MKKKPSLEQMVAVTEFLEKNPIIARGMSHTAHEKMSTKTKWNAIAPYLNSLGDSKRDGKQWAKFWADKKFAMKKVLRRINKDNSDEIVLTPIEERLVAVMNGLKPTREERCVEIVPSPTTSYEETVPVKPTVNWERANTPEDDNIEPSSPPDPLRSPGPHRPRSRAPRTALYRLIATERRRVQAELLSAKALTQAAEQMSGIHTAIDNLATATRNGAQVVSEALLAIADALGR